MNDARLRLYSGGDRRRVEAFFRHCFCVSTSHLTLGFDRVRFSIGFSTGLDLGIRGFSVGLSSFLAFGWRYSRAYLG